MNWERSLILIALLIALSGYFYFYEVKGAAKRKIAEEKRKEEEWRKIQIFPYQPQDFRRIRLVKDNRTIVYQKEGEVWWMKEPMRINGDEKAVDDIIHSIINVVECEPVADDASDLVQFGLEHPRMEISVHLEGLEEPRTLLLGNDNPTFITIYAKLEGSSKVFLVGSLIRWEISKEFYNLDHRTGPFFPDKEGT